LEQTKREEAMGIPLVSYGSFAVKRKIKKRNRLAPFLSQTDVLNCLISLPSVQ